MNVSRNVPYFSVNIKKSKNKNTKELHSFNLLSGNIAQVHHLTVNQKTQSPWVKAYLCGLACSIMINTDNL